MTLELSFFPSEQLVPAISKLVADFCNLVFSDPNVTMRYHMAAQELAENVVKYGDGPVVSLGVQFRHEGGGYLMRLRATNTASPEKLADVRRHVEALKTTPDPEALYDGLILAGAGIEGTSGLGLARIRAEGRLRLDYAIDGNELTITAEASSGGDTT